MSRTDNTAPLRIQYEDGATFFTRGGAFSKIGEDCRYPERQARQRARLALLKGEEPEPTRHRGSAKWRYW